ncbi:hypothetical protein ACIRPX_04540 [Streptomyces sp. NPDC101225]|uniref:hypothetical protein n=1 Tax=Streptomyces sp. NPDC101225 TaxID=3366135 RepID=UPI003803E9D3
MKKWRKDAQLDWPEPASGAQAVPTSGEADGKAAAQSFPDSGTSGVSRGDFAGPGPRDGADPGRTQRPTDSTEVLSGGSRAVAGYGAAEHDRAAGLRDPWEPVGESAHAHDPHEVTVQLDAVSLQDSRLRTAAGEPGGGSDSSDGPVFVDESGRRSRRFRRLGMAVGIACAVYAVVIVATLLSGSSDAPWLPVPGQKDDKPAGQVQPTSLPTESAVPSGTGGPSAGSAPTAGAGTTPTPGASGVAPVASAGTAKPGASTAPDAKPSTSTTKPTSGLADPKPSTSAAPTKTTAPAPTPTESTVAPTETPVDGSGGNAPVANGAVSPSPVVEASATSLASATPLASSAPSPETTL